MVAVIQVPGFASLKKIYIFWLIWDLHKSWALILVEGANLCYLTNIIVQAALVTPLISQISVHIYKDLPESLKVSDLIDIQLKRVQLSKVLLNTEQK